MVTQSTAASIEVIITQATNKFIQRDFAGSFHILQCYKERSTDSHDSLTTYWNLYLMLIQRLYFDNKLGNKGQMTVSKKFETNWFVSVLAEQFPAVKYNVLLNELSYAKREGKLGSLWRNVIEKCPFDDLKVDCMVEMGYSVEKVLQHVAESNLDIQELTRKVEQKKPKRKPKVLLPTPFEKPDVSLDTLVEDEADPEAKNIVYYLTQATVSKLQRFNFMSHVPTKFKNTLFVIFLVLSILFSIRKGARMAGRRRILGSLRSVYSYLLKFGSMAGTVSYV